MLGLGTVGAGVAQALLAKADGIARRVGCPVVLHRALVRDPRKPRAIDSAFLTTDPAAVLEDPAILERAAARGLDVAFEASVGGGIPVIGPFRLDLLANDIQEFTAIINGTTNFILTKMAREGVGYADALHEAQTLGYAEPDPRNDVEGIDAAYKLTILATLAFHARVRPGDVYREGITHLTAADFRYARELGYAIKLLAIGRAAPGGFELRVPPTFLPADEMLAKVDGVFNAVRVDGDLVGQVLFYGRGAGAGPTSSAVVADVIDLAQRVRGGAGPTPLPPLDPERRAMPI